MRIENLYQEQVVNQYSQGNKTTEQEIEKKSKSTGKDVFEMSEEVPVMPSETYNDFAQIVKTQMSAETGTEDENEDEDASMQMQGMPPMPPKPPMPTTEELEEATDEETSTTTDATTSTTTTAATNTSTVTDTVNSVISNIAEALGVSASEVFETLKELKLSPNDLLSEEGLTSVISALTSGTTTTAEETTTVSTTADTTQEDSSESTDTDDTASTTLSATIASLKELMESALESLQEKLGMTDEEFEEYLNSSNDFGSNVAAYSGGNIGNMGTTYDMQQFIDMLQSQGVSVE